VHRNVEKTHPFEVYFENGHVGTQASGHSRGIHA
jgi:hypothetical protein